MSLTGIVFNCNPPPLLIIFTIFKHTYITALYDDYNPITNSVKLMVSEVLMFHENKDLFLSGDSYNLYPGNNYPIERITLVFVGITIRNQLGWVEVVKDD